MPESVHKTQEGDLIVKRTIIVATGNKEKMVEIRQIITSKDIELITMKDAGVDVRLHVKEKMGHVYPLWPCPEGKEAREEIAEIIALTSNT